MFPSLPKTFKTLLKPNFSSPKPLSPCLAPKSLYYSNYEDRHTNGVLCVTGIPLEEHTEDVAKAKNLYAQTLALQDQIGHVLTEDEKEFKSYKDIVEKTDVPDEYLHEDINCEDAYKYNKWYRNRLIYSIRKDPDLTEENGNIEYDTAVHQELMKDKLFYWNRFRVMETERSTCPIKALAVFTHDYPIKTENHPLIHIIKDLYEKSKEEITQLSMGGLFDSDSDEEVKTITFNAQKMKDKLTLMSKSGLLPNICNIEFFKTEQNLINSSKNNCDTENFNPENIFEFDQEFYSSKFQNGEEGAEYYDHIDSSICTETLEKAISEIDQGDKYMEMLNALDTKCDFFRLRLSAIAYDLGTQYSSYDFSLKSNKSGRFVSILGLDKVVRSTYPGVNIDIHINIL